MQAERRLPHDTRPEDGTVLRKLSFNFEQMRSPRGGLHPLRHSMLALIFLLTLGKALRQNSFKMMAGVLRDKAGQWPNSPTDFNMAVRSAVQPFSHRKVSRCFQCDLTYTAADTQAPTSLTCNILQHCRPSTAFQNRPYLPNKPSGIRGHPGKLGVVGWP